MTRRKLAAFAILVAGAIFVAAFDYVDNGQRLVHAARSGLLFLIVVPTATWISMHLIEGNLTETIRRRGRPIDGSRPFDLVDRRPKGRGK